MEEAFEAATDEKEMGPMQKEYWNICLEMFNRKLLRESTVVQKHVYCSIPPKWDRYYIRQENKAAIGHLEIDNVQEIFTDIITELPRKNPCWKLVAHFTKNNPIDHIIYEQNKSRC